MRDRDWDKFIETTIGGYMSVALSYTKSFEEAEDIVWGVYGRLLEKDYPPPNLPTIGLKSVHNASRNHIARRPRYVDIDDYHPPFYPPTDMAIDISIIEESLSALLSDREGMIFYSYTNGMSYMETGEAHGITAGAVRAHMHRSRKKIKNKFPEYANTK